MGGGGGGGCGLPGFECFKSVFPKLKTARSAVNCK